MKNFKDKKILVVGGVLLALIAGTYFYFSGYTATTTDTVSAPEETITGNQEVLRLLTELRSISLENDLFSDQAFQTLQDFGVNLESQPVGRSNPFAPIGVEINFDSTEATTSPQQ